MIFADSSFLVALAIDIDPNHDKALRAIPADDQGKVTSEDIIKETLTIISQRKGRNFCIEFFDGISREYIILPASSERYRAGLKLFLNPKLQKNVSLIDCISAAICQELGIKRILSFDDHFKALGVKVAPTT